MKKIYTLIIATVFSFFGFSQSNIHIYDTNYVEITGQIITINGPSDQILDAEVLVEQKTGVTKDINVKRYEVSIVTGSMNYFCWWQCYAPQNSGTNSLWVAPDPLTMLTDSVYHNFYGYHNGMGNSGVATYRYVFYDINNPSDSAYIDIVFDTWPASVNEIDVAKSVLHYPNPVNNQLTIKYDIANAQNAYVIVSDIVGKQVAVLSILPRNNRVLFNTSGLIEGVYFYTLYVDKQKITTKKFMVVH